MSIDITPAPEHTLKRPDHTLGKEILCPFCKEKQSYDEDPRIKIAAIFHTCPENDNKKVFFLNGYAMTGVEEFNGAERLEKTH